MTYELHNVEHLVLFGSRPPIGRYDRMRIAHTVRSLPANLVLVIGGAKGVDEIALNVAIERCKAGTLAGLIVCPAQWKDYREMGRPKAAGPVRNSLQAKLGDSGIGWRKPGKSNGTDDMADKLRRQGKEPDVRRLA